MRLTLVSWNFPPRLGGAERLAHRLALHLGEGGTEVTVLTGSGPAVELPCGRVVRSPLPGFAGFLAWLVPALLWTLLRPRPDAGLVVGAQLAAVTSPWFRLARVPQAALVFGSDLVHGGPVGRAVVGRLLAGCDRVVAISRYVARAARGLGVPPDRLAVVPPGVDPDLPARPFDPAVPATDLPVILFVGRVVPRKGLGPFLEDCLPRVVHRVAAELWVVGGEPSDSLVHPRGELARLRAYPATAGRVRFLGRVPDEVLFGAYRRARVLVLPAVEEAGDVEGFGIVFLEAALFGVPAVSSAVGGIPDAVVDGETGFLVAPGDWAAMAERITELLTDRALRDRLGRQARERAERSFAWATIARRLDHELRSISR